ncbi:MAG: GNAT family N-acetyltransferase [Clostridia bacterium]|nr:GNAT family N-acetyltransferase [Clostridia bacterium]
MELFKGRCPKEYTDHLIDTLDDIFFFEDDEETKRNFRDLLPKLYKEQYNPAYNNLVVMEDDKVKGAVGLYPFEATAAGRKLRVGGIGNVGVTRDCRGKGYMKDCMNMSLDEMIKDNTDYSLLGGHRQRYAYFGFEQCGPEYDFNIDMRNIRHCIGKDAKTTFTAREIKPEDKELLAKTIELYKRSSYTIDRNEDNVYDILSSWRSVPYAAFEGDEFKGYFVLQKFGGIHEICPVNIEDTLNLIMCIMETMGKDSVSFSVPFYKPEMCAYMTKYCGGWDVSHSEMINILNYGRFIEAFLAVKAKTVKLCSGSLVLLIHGYKQDERIEITVNGEDVKVCETTKDADLEVEHLEAIRLVASLFSESRLTLPAFAQNWFPVYFSTENQDNV